MRFFSAFSFVFLFVLSGCANLIPLNQPQVNLVGIEPVKGTGLTPRFTLQLMITNPNDMALDIDGVSFEFLLADQKILSGVANNIPSLEAYGETPVEVQGSISLFKLFNLLRKLSNSSSLEYRLKTTIDPDGFPAFEVEQKGNLSEKLQQGIKKAKFLS